MQLRVFDICREGTHVLGPGNRYVVWVQGCNMRCAGCITPESQSVDGGIRIECGDIAADIILSCGIDGITISGGEPFLQAEALADMLQTVRARRPELTVIIYTGYEFERLHTLPGSKRLLDCADVVIDGRYEESLNDNKGIRGSNNQRIISLTNRLSGYISAMESGQRKIQYAANGDGTFSSIGVPPTFK